MKIIAREAYFVLLKKVSPEQMAAAKERNTFQFYKDSACEKCPYFEDRPCDVCDSCPNNLGKVSLAKTVEVNDKLYLSLPIGDREGLEKIFPDEEIEIVPKYPIVPMKNKPEFVGSFKKFAFQPAAIADLIKKKRGVLKSAPRTGKTAMAAAAICKLGFKTIILAAQRDWLVNFHETFVGSKTQKAMTDINPRLIGFARTLEDFKRYEVCLVTYQLFISPKGQALLEKVRKMFTVMVVDECFTYGHKVRTELGLISIGDIVTNQIAVRSILSFNHKTKKEEFKPIESVTRKVTKKLLRIKINGKIFMCTPSHKFWVANKKEYIKAQDLIIGDKVRLRQSK